MRGRGVDGWAWSQVSYKISLNHLALICVVHHPNNQIL